MTSVARLIAWLCDRWALTLMALWLMLVVAYLLSAPPDITFEDTSLFAGACGTLGLPHPPGYPLYVLTCFPVTRLFMWAGYAQGFGGAAASAMAAAGACVLLAIVFARVCGSRLAALLGAGLLGLAPTYWDQAQIPEVYGLNMLMLALSWYLCQRLVEGAGQRWLQALALVAGLGLAVHWPLYVLSFPAMLLWLGPAWPRIFAWLRDVRLWLKCAGCFALGLLPYVHLLLVSDSAYLFDQQYTATDFISYVRRDIYDLDQLLTLEQRLFSALQTTVWFVREYHYVFALPVVVGLGMLIQQLRWWQLAAITWSMLATTLMLTLLRPYEPGSSLSLWFQHAYPLPAYAFAALPLVICVAWMHERWWRNSMVGAQLAVWGVLLLVLTWWFPTADRSDDRLALWHNRLILEAVPQDTLVLNTGSDFGFALDYLAHFELRRPDVKIVDEVTYLQGLYFDRQIAAAAEARLAAEVRPVVLVNYLKLNSLGLRFHGTHYSLDPTLAPGKVQVELNPAVREYIRYLYELRMQDIPRNVFSAIFLRNTIIEIATRLENARLHSWQLHPADLALLHLLAQTPEGQFALFRVRLTSVQQLTLMQVEQAAAAVLPYFSDLSPPIRAEYLHLIASAYVLAGDFVRGQDLLYASLREYPTVQNDRVIIDLLQIIANDRDYAGYAKLRKEYPGLEVGTALDKYDKRCADELRRACTAGH